MNKNREKTVIKTSVISIVTNIVLVGFKAFVGLLANSIAIVSDAINNLSDALSSIITIVGTKLAGKAPDKKHPYGYGRVEYMTSLAVSGIVLYAGITALVESVKKIIQPETPDYSTVTIIILVAGILVKFALGLYVKKVGKDVRSDSLVASGTDAFNDAILSISVLVSAIIYMIFHVNLEAYVGVIVSVYIIKAGIDLVKGSVDNILGVRVESGLAKKIKKEVLKVDEVQGAFDLVLNDYGPGKFSGSIHIEVANDLTVADIDKISRKITKNVLKKYGVIIHTIGVYSVNTDNKKSAKVKEVIREIVFSHEGILEFHGFYYDEVDKIISFDIIIDFEVKEKEKVYTDIYNEVKTRYQDFEIEITSDVDISD